MARPAFSLLAERRASQLVLNYGNTNGPRFLGRPTEDVPMQRNFPRFPSVSSAVLAAILSVTASASAAGPEVGKDAPKLPVAVLQADTNYEDVDLAATSREKFVV